jgi:soluble lytic murein transglycosylase-like protein
MIKKIIVVNFILLFLCTAFCFAEEQDQEIDPVTQKYHDVIFNTVFNRSGLGNDWSEWITWTIINYCYQQGVDPLIITAKYAIESNFHPDALSGVGAIGIAQLMPETASAIGVNPYDPGENILGGILYFKNQLNNFQWAGDWAATYAEAAYNAGPGAVKAYNGVPPYSETINHINQVGNLYMQLRNDFNI